MSKKRAEQGGSAVLEPKSFRVKLDALTPLAVNDVAIEASDADEAWGKFCAMNGISGSSCERTITEVKE